MYIKHQKELTISMS